MKRKLLIVLLSIICALCLAFGLTACGNSSGGTTDGGQNNEQTGNTDDGNSSSGDNTGSGSGSSTGDDGGSSSGDSGDSGSSSGDTEQSGSTGGDTEEAVSLEYILSGDNSSYIVSGIGGVTSTTVTIPSTYNGLPVTAIADGAFKNNTIIVIIIIADSVTTIGENAFSGCTSLTSVTIGSGVTTIGASAFSGCSSLTSVNIPSGVNAIEENAFGNCTALESVAIYGDPEIESSAFSGCKSITEITLSNELLEYLYELLQNVFVYSTSITEVKDTSSATYHAHELTYNAKVEATCTESGTEEYWYCSTCDKYYSDENGSTEVNKDSLTISATGHINEEAVIENEVAATCTTDGSYDNVIYCSTCGEELNRETVTIVAAHTPAEAVKENEIVATCGQAGSYDSVIYCSVCDEEISRETITVEATGEHTYTYKYDENNHWQVCTVCGNTTEGKSHTLDSNNICSICGYEKIIDSVGLAYTLSGDGTYYTVSGIGTCTDTKLVIPSTYEGLPITSIGNQAFYYCTSLTSVTIGNSVTSIGYGAFFGCTSLTSVTIPDSVTSIGKYAFYNCTALTKINFNATAMKDLYFSNYVFYGAGKSSTGITVIIGANVTRIPAYLFCPYNSSYAPNITSVVFEEGSLCTNIGNYAFEGCTSLTSVIIGNSVTSIGEYAFYCCTKLTSITIPESVIYIGDYAFAACLKLTSITIPKSVTYIGSRAFATCSKLTSVTFENTSGWYVTQTSGATSGTNIISSYLSNTSIAATYLTDAYHSYYWYRSES